MPLFCVNTARHTVWKLKIYLLKMDIFTVFTSKRTVEQYFNL